MRSLGVAAAALALSGLPPSRGNAEEPPVAPENGSEEAQARAASEAQARAASRGGARARAASRECLARAAGPTRVPRGAAGSTRASRFECDVELLPELARLSVLYGADGWSGGRALSWQDLRD